MSTSFVDVYNRFFGKITDDMYMELTPEDTMKDLRQLLIDAIPNFEFPRKSLDYSIETIVVREDQVQHGDFIIGTIWNTPDGPEDENIPDVYIERSHFNSDLTSEEINILAFYMVIAWLQRQITSIENTRMKFSGTDFKFTSQANHLSKLVSLKNDVADQAFHAQRLYKRRRFTEDGSVETEWDRMRNGRFGKYRVRY